MNKAFPEIAKKLGFGCMRLPMKNGVVDEAEFTAMADEFLARGFNYFDTARGYLGGLSETALKACLTSRHPRTSFLLADKLTERFFKTESDILPYFEGQLEACGVEYFDFYLMHAQNSGHYEKFKRCHAYEHAFELKRRGKIRHVGISFHDSAAVLDRILSEYPQLEFVQLQLNYLDYEDPGIQSRLCLETCARHGKPVMVMEPVKGGTLARLPEDAAQVIAGLGGGSQASYAIRFAAGFPGIAVVLSGMSSLEQMKDNLSFMQDFKPLDEREKNALETVCGLFRARHLIACTGCRYCTDGCPKHIPIPDLFADMNAKKLFEDWNSDWYHMVHTMGKGRAGDCVRCGSCEKECPQNLPIRDLLRSVAETFEKKD